MITGEGIHGNQKNDVTVGLINEWEQLAEKAYKDSGLFSDIKMGAADTDLRAEIHVIARVEGISLLEDILITVRLSPLIIPNKVNAEVVLETVLKDREGQQLGSFEKKETITTWHHLFLIFMLPFNRPDTVVEELHYDLIRATIIEAYHARLLAQSY